MEQIKQNIALIGRARNLQAWDNWVAQRVGIVQTSISKLRNLAALNTTTRAASELVKTANKLQGELDAAIAKRANNK